MEERTARNEFGGSAHAVVQASVVHFHGVPWPPTKVPHQLPPHVDLVNQVRVPAELECGTADRPPLDAPVVKVVLGPRGSGKSTVATAWLDDVRDRFPDVAGGDVPLGHPRAVAGCLPRRRGLARPGPFPAARPRRFGRRRHRSRRVRGAGAARACQWRCA
ncbi:hypothetical protein [Saccharothrix luteola]|uniref:hypothetical protein n=1 Tax=Saccharothrix luteola TaxID=2893018 RepID=UPI001E3EE90C|nr:hypothetical protein [Saccharothrix luteola]MCC8246056.1 hypothetical protein [Saccharothrix luteola]